MIFILSAVLILNTFSIEFEREYVECYSKEVVKGIIYYQAPTKVIIKVDKPIDQVIVLSKGTMTIYYPNEKKAFRIKTKRPFSIPFVEAFFGAMKENYGLTELGYTLLRHEIKRDTLYTYWDPPKKAKKILGQFTLGFVKNRLVYAEAKNADGKPTTRIQYRNHIQHGAIYFPLEIITIRYTKTDTTFEKTVYKNPQFDKPLPPQIIDFKIPHGIKVKEIEWQ